MGVQAVFFILIILSAETNCNKLKIIQGHKNSEDFLTEIDNVNELTKHGAIQSILLAKKISNVKFDEIIYSDLKRTELTAEEIIKLTNKENLQIRKTDLIREKNFGILTGKFGEFYRYLTKVF